MNKYCNWSKGLSACHVAYYLVDLSFILGVGGIVLETAGLQEPVYSRSHYIRAHSFFKTTTSTSSSFLVLLTKTRYRNKSDDTLTYLYVNVSSIHIGLRLAIRHPSLRALATALGRRIHSSRGLAQTLHW
jgi:hypothetical protein